MSEAFRHGLFAAQQVARQERAFPRSIGKLTQQPSHQVASNRRVAECASGDVRSDSGRLEFTRWQEDRIPAPSIRLGRETVTFGDLLLAREALVTGGEVGADAFAVERAALNRFMECFSLKQNDLVAPQLTNDFAKNLSAFRNIAIVSGIGGKKLNGNTVPSYMSRLKKFHALALTMLATSETFTDAYQRLVASWKADAPGRNFKELSKVSGVSLSSILSWNRGNRPLEKSTPNIRLLEIALGANPGELAAKIFDRQSLGSRADDDRRTARLSDDSKMPHFNRILYLAKYEELSPALKYFFDELELFKTTRFPTGFAGQQLKRARRAKKTAETLSAWSVKFRHFASGMLGWLVLPNTLGGAKDYILNHTRGRPMSSAQADLIAPMFVGMGYSLQDLTPCHMVDPTLVGGFMDWKTRRSRNVESGYHRSFISEVMALTRTEVGFLTQRPEFAWDYLHEKPINKKDSEWRSDYKHSAAQWAERCADIHNSLRQIQSELNKYAKARDPRVELGPILNEPDPMRPIIEIIREHELTRPTKSALAVDNREHSLALWWRDQLLLRLIVSNPLRSKNFRMMSWKADENLNLYRTDKGWRIKFDPQDFKNENGAARDPYNVEVSSALTSLIDIYMTEARPILLRGKSTEAVFVTSTGGRFGGSGISEVLEKLSRRYLRTHYPEMTALRAHAFRHIVATSWLRSHPDQFRAVAMILHDTLATVLANYDHTRPEEGLRQWNDWLSSKLPSLKK